jgi:hypothetical protein
MLELFVFCSKGWWRILRPGLYKGLDESGQSDKVKAVITSLSSMTSHINVKNKQGLTKLATLIKQAGFNDVQVTVKAKSITLVPTSPEADLSAGLADLKAGRYASFKSPSATIAFLSARGKEARKPVTKRSR